MRIILFIGILLIIAGQQQAQEPFVCQCNFYISLSPTGSSTVYKFQIDPNTDNVVLEALPAGGLGFTINSIGYRITDNFIYGIQTETLNLYRIGADGSATLLTTLSGINTSWGYPAGDITPDGRYLVILGGSGGFGGEGTSEALVFIDLESPDYATTTIEMPSNNVRCFDIAFDPTDGKLYGFDSGNSRIVSINTQTGQINTSLPSSGFASAMGSLFFDAFGNLYGYGAENVLLGQNIFFHLNKETGEISQATTGPVVERSDACSCPYTIQLQKTVEPETAVPCTEVSYFFEFANSSGKDQDQLTFRDTLPEEFIITAIDNSFGGNIVSGIGTNILVIESMTIPLGRNFLEVKVEIGEQALGIYNNQARLEGLPEALGLIAVSDNPKTLIQNDPTPITIEPLEIDFSEVEKEICRDEEILLSPFIHGVNYQWSDGSTEPTFLLNRGGTYAVTVTSGCDIAIETITVEEHVLIVDLPETATLHLGDSIRLQPCVSGDQPFSYSWIRQSENISCLVCPEPFVRPYFDTWYTLEVIDSNGCVQQDSTLITLIKNRKVYIPNAFSPNDDGINDWFYLQSRTDEIIRDFRVFSRWGELIFQAEGVWSNIADTGWDGTFEGKPMPSGVYIFWIQVEFLDGFLQDFSGDINLIR